MKKILLGLFLLTMMGNAHAIKSAQLIVVTTDNWNASTGKLQRYKKINKRLHKVGKAINVFVGRNGLGWGRGLHTIPKNAKVVKKEGDGKAPAGIFELKQAFGYDFFDVKYPFVVYHKTDHCVDDVNSKFYNKIVDSKKVRRDYRSKENMKFSANYYKYGIVVNHNHINEKNAIKGAGSCIFIHIKERPTAGCTVMSPKNIKKIIAWLDFKKRPLLVQGTSTIIKKLLKKIGILYK